VIIKKTVIDKQTRIDFSLFENLSVSIVFSPLIEATAKSGIWYISVINSCKIKHLC